MVNKRLDECFKEIADLKSRWTAHDTKLQEFEINTLKEGGSVKPYYVEPY